MAATLSSIVTFLDQLLAVQTFQDTALNGLQVESGSTEIKSVAVAVDAGSSIIERAIDLDADLLIVHHGIFWGECRAITGGLGKKVRKLLSGQCSLYASHLPLDAHLSVGNGAELARFFGLGEIQGYFEYRGQNIGVKASLSSAKPLQYFVDRAKEMIGALATPLLLPFGASDVRTVGIVTGSGSSALDACALAGLDLLISGEPKQEVYHHAKELRQSCLFAGHYATETFGIRALQRILSDRFRVETHFIDEPTGI